MGLNVIPLISEEKIQERVEQLGRTISIDYKGKPLHVVGILKGAWMFMADLIRHVAIPVTTDFLAVASYGSGTESSGTITMVSDLRGSIEGKDVLLIEDIVDTGLSLQFVLDTLSQRSPESLRVCALLDKPDRHQVEVRIHYLGFTVPDQFVVGYGIDYDEQFRNLPHIGYVEFVKQDDPERGGDG